MTEAERQELERYRAFHAALRQRQEQLPLELEALRQAGKGKTVKFRELLGEKLATEDILARLRRVGLP